MADLFVRYVPFPRRRLIENTPRDARSRNPCSIDDPHPPEFRKSGLCLRSAVRQDLECARPNPGACSVPIAAIQQRGFVLVLEDIHHMGNIAPLLERLQLDLDVPYTLSDTLSMGITLYPDDNVDAQGLLRHAEQALGEVKANKAQRSG